MLWATRLRIGFQGIQAIVYCGIDACRCGLFEELPLCSLSTGHLNPTPSHLQALLVDECDSQPRLHCAAHAPQLHGWGGTLARGLLDV